jgi:hypothetical protein
MVSELAVDDMSGKPIVGVDSSLADSSVDHLSVDVLSLDYLTVDHFTGKRIDCKPVIGRRSVSLTNCRSRFVVKLPDSRPFVVTPSRIHLRFWYNYIICITDHCGTLR